MSLNKEADFNGTTNLVNIMFRNKTLKTPEPLLRGKNQKSTNL